MFNQKDKNNKVVLFDIEFDETNMIWYMDAVDKDFNFLENKFSSATIDRNQVIKEAREYIKNNALVK